MHKFVITSVLAILSLNLVAQTNMTTADNVKSEVTIKVSKKSKRHKYFSDNAPVTMADGSVKSIADVKVGEHVKTCKGGKSMATQVRQIDVYNKPDFSLTAIYLRPAEGIANYDPKMIPALLLEATPNHRVQTSKGKKRLKQLSKNDILYHYEPSTGIVSSWKVGAVKQNARIVSKAYNLETEDGTYLVDNVMVAQ
ncbi:MULTISPECIES: hypothetical protein [Dyadobacter]|uniref:Hint domain-containing protein n=1 Tax=Dyadobacter chenhuakuii TaxID=2909339 RepID=A0A9X1QGW4_9BACT|nr:MULTISPECIES: hypothetical protein [Dyadobacter]MCE7071279.1 hypothetical protein [Dyadobacter sp. CY327]MCF2493837.1 hypothetical protein [Dyadobacter chenhuakuii]MCF2500654.1 hypothetical protein [Dyadobacter chenhuakuii]MCF2518082.1 hypothetical protein [Dyadobacter sp. CY351]USJ30969.1 hypothetical protein NFI80_24315 [Dyadobacter chenhuakuii]